MITRERALTFEIGKVLYHPSRARLNQCEVIGQAKIWEERPGSFCLPVKSGLKIFYITDVDGKDWLESQPVYANSGAC
jgi:hypothetical protein